jgi:methylthioribose-1-phosphate isomerase
MSQIELTNIPRSIWWDVDETDGLAGVYLIDQTRLPLQGDVLCCRTLEGVEVAVQTLALRGAPALGVGAAMAIAVWSENESTATTIDEWLTGIDAAAQRISQARPTAVNLAWGAERTRAFAHDYVTSPPDFVHNYVTSPPDYVAQHRHPEPQAKDPAATVCTDTDVAVMPPDATAPLDLAAAKAALVAFAQQMAADDEATNRALGANGAPLILPGSRVLTHCNAGSLATAYFGTALGVIYTAFEQGKIEHVWVDETRPLNQGARLTSWELLRAGVPCVTIADNMAASVMAEGWVDAILVGADRICKNGDTANKIGTLGLALMAKHYAIPFYVCAPESTIDRTLSEGSKIPIEQRDPRELAGFTASGVITPDDAVSAQAFDALTAQGARHIAFKAGHEMVLDRKGGGYSFDAWFRTTPPQAQFYNPAFDVTPANLITAIITEKGVYKPTFSF